MTTAVAPTGDYTLTVAEPPSYFEKLLNGDLSDLTPEERTAYYLERCRSIGLDPMSQPFLFMQTRAREGEQPKTILYTTRSATDQIAKRDALSGSIVSRDVGGGIAIVVVRITDGTRTVENIGAASFKYDNQAGDALKRATTQAYRRGIIQYAGVGAVSEEDIEDIAGAQKLGMMGVELPATQARRVNRATGEVLDAPAPPKQLRAAPAKPADPAPPARPATPEHRAKLANLLALLGRGVDLPGDLTEPQALVMIAGLTKEAKAAAPSEAQHDELLAIATDLHDAGAAVPTWSDDLTLAGWQAIMVKLRQIRDEHEAKARRGRPRAVGAGPGGDDGPDGDNDTETCPSSPPPSARSTRCAPRPPWPPPATDAARMPPTPSPACWCSWRSSPRQSTPARPSPPCCSASRSLAAAY